MTAFRDSRIEAIGLWNKECVQSTSITSQCKQCAPLFFSISRQYNVRGSQKLKLYTCDCVKLLLYIQLAFDLFRREMVPIISFAAI